MASRGSVGGRAVWRRESWLPAVMTLVAVVGSFASLYAVSMRLGAGAQAGVLAAVLALTLGRRRLGAEAAAWWLEFALLPVVALGAAAVGWLLHWPFALGAVVFVLGVAGAVWLRRWGEEGRRLSGVVMLAFVAILVAPVPVHTRGGVGWDLLLVMAAGVVALSWVLALDALGRRLGWLARGEAVAPPVRAARAGWADPFTRMAMQMAVALAAAMLVGRWGFGLHWRWVVVTAFIVCSSSVGRGDALYRGVLRLGGALVGSLLAALVGWLGPLHGAASAGLMFAALFVGVWLREVSYAFWAGALTLVLALLMPDASQVLGMLGLRLTAIVAGAACGVAAAWWVLPIRTEAVVRRYLADALLALEAWAGATEGHAGARAVLAHRVGQFERVAAVVGWHHRLTRAAADADHPAVWIGLTRECAGHAAGLPTAPAGLVRAVRLARRSLVQEEESIAAALRKVRGVLVGETG